MKREIVVFNCKIYDSRTKRATPFYTVRYTFNYQTNPTDKAFLDNMVSEGTKLANKVNPGAASNASQKRDYDKILNNCIAGVLSEYLWKNYLNSTEQLVNETPFVSANNQIDLQILKNAKKIEVRSSFPRNGIDFALCSGSHEFDVIGMYSNGYKPAEVQKDYYVRALFHLGIERYWEKDAHTRIPIMEKLIDKLKKDGFEAFLTGGATWDMMIDTAVAKNKNFIPEDEIQIGRLATATEYRVVPFSNALDSIEIKKRIEADI
jgi:hypothetical protein